MSLRPLFFANWWDGLDEPHHVPDHHLGVHPGHWTADIHAPSEMLPYTRLARGPHGLLSPAHSRYYNRPYPTEHYRSTGGGLSTQKHAKDNFQVVLDVQQFAPEEINVKVVDKHVIVEAQHDEKKDEHGWISRKFCRKYLIPEQCDMDHVASRLSTDGILTISVPRKKLPTVEGERIINIQHTGKPAIQVKKPEQTPVEVKKIIEK